MDLPTARLSKRSERMKAPVLLRMYAGTSGVAKGTFYAGRHKYAAMDSSAMKRPKELEMESTNLKRMNADMALSNEMLHDAGAKIRRLFFK